MISGFIMAPLPVVSSADLGPAIEGCRPAAIVIVARFPAFEVPVNEHEARAAWHGVEGHRHLGLVAANTAGVFPRPGESEAARRLDDAVDPARRKFVAVGAAHRDA